ncbi:ABC transporter ATP-binding protein [Actinomycetaceae bacterium MB13-C1-2]|nr:ABC transporter ATP-binding protein [Actinomycetaceae bacterium MB13-C1-2]
MSLTSTETAIPLVRVNDVTKRYGNTIALDRVSTTLEPGTVYGLLGRNGAGKTTLMSILHAQSFPTSGSVRIGGQNPAGSPRALEQICFIRENQRYPDQATCPSVLKTASWFYPNWNQTAADELANLFELPRKTATKKLSRGQASALAATVGLASRAQITLFDEPYLGLDAVARDRFYRYLTQEIDLFPRTVLISSHLIDEIGGLIDHVLLLDHGKLVLDQSAEELLERSHSIVGPTALVEDFCSGFEVLNSEPLGGISRYDVLGYIGESQREEAMRQGLDISPLPLQSLSTAIALHSAARAEKD